jgi:hypothetical protein
MTAMGGGGGGGGGASRPGSGSRPSSGGIFGSRASPASVLPAFDLGLTGDLVLGSDALAGGWPPPTAGAAAGGESQRRVRREDGFNLSPPSLSAARLGALAEEGRQAAAPPGHAREPRGAWI